MQGEVRDEVKSKLVCCESWSVLIGVSQHHAQEMAIRPPYLIAVSERHATQHHFAAAASLEKVKGAGESCWRAFSCGALCEPRARAWRASGREIFRAIVAIVAMAAVWTWLHIQVKDARVGRERLWTTL